MGLSIRRIFIVLIVFFTASFVVKGQSDTISLNLNSKETDSQFKVSQYILPASLIATGVAIYCIPKLEGVDNSIRDEFQKHPWNTKLDYVTAVTPAAMVFALDFCGVGAKHSFRDRFIVTASSYAIGEGSMLLMKAFIDRRRPDGSSFTSFPSGHTGTAFIGAHILMKEYKHISPWIGVSGYAIATATGYMRMANNKHWFSDVVAGAGIGILSAEVGYLLLPYLSKTIAVGQKDKRLSFSPAAGTSYTGFNLSYTF